MRLAAAILAVVALSGCAARQSPESAVRGADILRTNLSVAAAALSAGQPEAARRQYLSLARRFEHAPEPVLGLGYIAFGSGDHAGAERHFARSAALAEDAPAVRAEALLGAGRAALARNEIGAARRYLRESRDIAGNSRLAPWIANAVAVAAALDNDLDTAEAAFGEALRLSSDHPRIAANLVRMLVAVGRHDDAAGIFDRHEPSFWVDDDGGALSRLIEEARRDPRNYSLALAFAPGTARHLPETGWPPAAEGIGSPLASGVTLRLAAIADHEAPGTGPEDAAEPPADPPDTSREAAPPDRLTIAPGQGMRLALDGDAASVLIASPAIADVQLLSPDMLYIIGKGIGQTSITVVGADGRAEDRAISVELDLDPLRAALASKPELEGVTARPFAHGVALIGEVSSASLAERAIRLAVAALPDKTPVENELRVTGAQQVNLEVQIAEVQRSISEDLGINWEAFGVSDGDMLGFRIGRLVTANFPSSFTGGDFTPGIFDGEVAPSVFFGRDTPGSRVMGMIEALSQAGLANVLARPNVTAISGEPASLFSGGEFPLPTGYDEGVLVFEYKKYGILLDFVPTVIDSSRISMHVRPEVSEPSISRSVQISGVSVPVINVRRAETTVEVADGESIVIAGLFRNASNSREAGLPVLKDIPGFGLLFGNRSTRSDELELIVIVTARLVESGKASGESRAPASRRAGGYYY